MRRNLSTYKTIIESFKRKICLVVNENSYCPDKLYNCNETDLSYKRNPSYKKSNDRFLLVDNSGRYKVRLCALKSHKNQELQKCKPEYYSTVYYTIGIKNVLG